MDTLEEHDELKDAMAVLNDMMIVYRTLAFDGKVYRGPWVPYIAQLTQVLDQLEKTGKCTIAGQVFEP
jgi:hypothetical protein